MSVQALKCPSARGGISARASDIMTELDAIVRLLRWHLVLSHCVRMKSFNIRV